MVYFGEAERVANGRKIKTFGRRLKGVECSNALNRQRRGEKTKIRKRQVFLVGEKVRV